MMFDEKTFRNYLNLVNYGDLEGFRIEHGFDFELDDKKKKKINKLFNFKLENKKKNYFFKKKNYLRNKYDMFALIKNSQEGLDVDFLLESYDNVKKDLVEIVKFSGKQRKLLILKRKGSFQLNIFPFENIYWILISKKTIQMWHLIKN